MIQRMGLLFSLLFVAVAMHAQMHEPIKCEASWKMVSDGVAELRVAAKIDAGWHVYSTELGDGPTSATLVVETIEGARLDGKLGFEGKEIAKYDEMFGMDVRYFEDEVTFVQRFAIDSEDYAVQGYFQYGACDDQSCLPPTNVEFKYGSAAVAAQPATLSAQSSSPFGALWEPVIDELGQPAGTANTATQSLWVIFLLGLAGGLVALVTPCVWPIIPMTVSFFLKRSGDKKKGRRDAYIYGISIVVIYVLLGLVVTLVFGASALNALSTAAVPNLFFFLLLVVFAMSFMGAFELTLPEKWTTAVDGKAEKTGGLLGIFLMAFTLTLVSFSCTGPIIGFLLVEVSTSGNILGPTIGMLGFAPRRSILD